jgi:hypothetical protein
MNKDRINIALIDGVLCLWVSSTKGFKPDLRRQPDDQGVD